MFISVVIWGSQAENVGKHLEKGSKVLIEGRLTEDRWTDKSTQQPRTKLKLTAESIEFIGSRKPQEQRQVIDLTNHDPDKPLPIYIPPPGSVPATNTGQHTNHPEKQGEDLGE